MRVGLVLLAALSVSACTTASTRYQSSNVLPMWLQPEAPSPHPSGMQPRNPKRVVPDGFGGYVLPDGTRAASDNAGGFWLPNGARAQGDGFGGVRLPNGNLCTTSPNGGFDCP